MQKRRRHRHNAYCDHVATARPRRLACPVCRRGVSGDRARWCLPHARWECDEHPGVGYAHCTPFERVQLGWERSVIADEAEPEPVAA